MLAIVLILALEAVQEREELLFPARIDNRAPAFSLDDLSGKRRASSEFEGHAGVVIAFLRSDHSEAETTLRRLERLACRMRGRDVVLVGIDVTELVPLEQIRRHYQHAGVELPILVDDHRTVARRYEVDNAPAFYLLDRQAIVRYRGDLDGLAAAIEETLAGKPVTNPQTGPWSGGL